MHSFLPPAGVALALALPTGASADPLADIAALRRDIETLRADYAARLQVLEERLRSAESALTGAPAAPIASAALPPASPGPAAGAGANAFNPALSLILSGLFARTSRDPADYAIGGFSLPPGAEIGPGSRGLQLTESELGFAASIDPWWRGAAAVALHADDSVSVEEAFVETTALGRGLSLKLGRFFSNIGYLNAQHAHVWDFVDPPLAYQAMLGGQYADDGLQLRWVAPTELYAEVSAEIGRGRTFPGSDTSRNGRGMASLALHLGGDVGSNHSWRAGLSLLEARAQDQELAAIDANGAAVTNRFRGDTRLWVIDGLWKWAPDGNPARRNAKLQAEWVQARRNGSLLYDAGGAATEDAYRVVQSGWYVQGVWQFMPRWRVGLRTERLDPGRPDYGTNAAMLGGTAYEPRKHAAMIDYSFSEFARLRLQLAHDRARADGAADRQLFLQYQMSLGAHGAHGF